MLRLKMPRMAQMDAGIPIIYAGMFCDTRREATSLRTVKLIYKEKDLSFTIA